MRKVGGWIAVLILLACSCSGGAEDNGDATTIQGFKAELSRLVCGSTGSCCSDAGYSYDTTSCTEFFSGAWPTRDKTAYDPEQGRECLDFIRAQAAESCWNAKGNAPACLNVVGGTVPEDGACAAAYECAAGAEEMAECLGGVCVPHPRGKLGDACHESCEEVGLGVNCATALAGTGPAVCYGYDHLECGPSGTCETVATHTRLEAGSPCESNDDCVLTSFCEPNGSSSTMPAEPMGTCVDEVEMRCTGEASSSAPRPN